MEVVLSAEVAAAVEKGRPIVALESTIISHGMPYPRNYNTALEVEEIIREEGATPATCAILDGHICVGLEKHQIEFLAKSREKVIKCSRRDIGYVLANKIPGATTVAGTMICANMAGIQVFVTGGIGGVHRGAQDSMDISADLTELGRTPVAVVSAGIKTILDIPKTLEYLETQGVSVITYKERNFPAFFIRDSGCVSHISVGEMEELAKVVAAQLQLNSGVVVAVPIPKEDQADGTVIQQAIDKALSELSVEGVEGKDITPFLLRRVNELTGGKSLDSNIKLVKNNARTGARLAKAMCELKQHAASE